jgi:hypothetical protein
MTWPNKLTGANSRPASPFDAGRRFGSALCAPPFLPAAVAQFCRSATFGAQEFAVIRTEGNEDNEEEFELRFLRLLL